MAPASKDFRKLDKEENASEVNLARCLKSLFQKYFSFRLVTCVCLVILVESGRCECFSNLVIPKAITSATNPTSGEERSLLVAKTGDKNRRRSPKNKRHLLLPPSDRDVLLLRPRLVALKEKPTSLKIVHLRVKDFGLMDQK